MTARLSIQQFELALSGETGSGRIISAEVTGSNADVQRALRMVGSAIGAPAARARVRDPETSHAAAVRAAEFAADHEDRIFKAITAAGERGATAKEIAAATGLTDVQVNRRLGSMGASRLIERRLRPHAEAMNEWQHRGRCAIWWVKS